ESGRMTISISAVNLQELISQVVAEVKPSADKQKLSLKTQIEPGAKLMVQADANKIKQVLVNLIGNAIKFTPSGGTITIAAVPEGEYIKTSVADSGKGLMKEDMPKLFKKFGMLEKNYTSKPTTQGTGLGLYISKSIIERHNGVISV